MLRAGDAGRAAGVKGEGDGFGFVSGAVLDTDGWRGIDGTGGGNAPAELAEEAVGVAWGVEAAEFALGTEIGAGVCLSLFAEGW